MQSSVQIKPFLSVEKMFEWLQGAEDLAAHKRRMAIWLTFTGELDASRIADILGVSTQSVWLWIRQYNAKGPAGLDRKGRGGRRWGFLSVQQESALLKPLLRRARSGSTPKTTEIKEAIEMHLGRKVSMPYVYRLLQRHRWFEIIGQSKPAKGLAAADTFEKLSKPWLRHD